MTIRTIACTRGSCVEPVIANGLCRRHYNRERDSGRHRDRPERVLYTRAKNRATAELIRQHRDEFDALVVTCREQVEAEAAELARLCAENGVEPTGDRQVWRFRSGPHPEDEDLLDRIVLAVGGCEHCKRNHASGHHCDVCGLAPQTEIAS